MNPIFLGERPRSGMGVIFLAPFWTYEMFYAVANQFLKFGALTYSQNKTEVEFEDGSDFLGYSSGPIGCCMSWQVSSQNSVIPALPGARSRSVFRKEVIFYVPFWTYEMIHTVTHQFLNIRYPSSSQCKTEVGFEVGSDFSCTLFD